MTSATVTVLMPVYNGEIYLREAIESILHQTYTDFEFLIINDGSTDNSESIIKAYNDSRIRYIKNESNLKLITTLNKGIELAKGKYIVRMDADDISTPNRIDKQVAFLEKNQEVGLCGSWFTAFGDVQESLCKYEENHQEILFKMFYQCHFCHPSLIIRKKVFEGMKRPFNPHYIHAEDYELYFQLSKKWKFHNLQESLLKYRIHNFNISKQYEGVQKENSLKIKKLFFSRIQTNISEEELDAFEALNYQSYDAITLSLDKMKLLLESMLVGNRKENFIESIFMEKELKRLWLNYCYHKSTIKSYKSSEILSDQKLLKNVNQLKWRMKSICIK
jgi:glycosyltransferase involved in cell wall biosynthesis